MSNDAAHATLGAGRSVVMGKELGGQQRQGPRPRTRSARRRIGEKAKSTTETQRHRAEPGEKRRQIRRRLTRTEGNRKCRFLRRTQGGSSTALSTAPERFARDHKADRDASWQRSFDSAIALRGIATLRISPAGSRSAHASIRLNLRAVGMGSRFELRTDSA